MISKVLKIIMWLTIFAVTFVAGFIGMFYYLDDAERVTKRFCNNFEYGERLQVVVDAGSNFEKGFDLLVENDKTHASLYLASGIFTVASCNLEFENEKLISKRHWVD